LEDICTVTASTRRSQEAKAHDWILHARVVKKVVVGIEEGGLPLSPKFLGSCNLIDRYQGVLHPYFNLAEGI
jgi:hypothetical protein